MTRLTSETRKQISRRVMLGAQDAFEGVALHAIEQEDFLLIGRGDALDPLRIGDLRR